MPFKKDNNKIRSDSVSKLETKSENLSPPPRQTRSVDDKKNRSKNGELAIWASRFRNSPKGGRGGSPQQKSRRSILLYTKNSNIKPGSEYSHCDDNSSSPVPSPDLVRKPSLSNGSPIPINQIQKYTKLQKKQNKDNSNSNDIDIQAEKLIYDPDNRFDRSDEFSKLPAEKLKEYLLNKNQPLLQFNIYIGNYSTAEFLLKYIKNHDLYQALYIPYEIDGKKHYLIDLSKQYNFYHAFNIIKNLNIEIQKIFTPDTKLPITNTTNYYDKIINTIYEKRCDILYNYIIQHPKQANQLLMQELREKNEHIFFYIIHRLSIDNNELYKIIIQDEDLLKFLIRNKYNDIFKNFHDKLLTLFSNNTKNLLSFYKNNKLQEYSLNTRNEDIKCFIRDFQIQELNIFCRSNSQEYVESLGFSR